jgi:hypothetical protein
VRCWKGHHLKWRSGCHVFLGWFSVTLVREQVLMLITSTFHLSISAWPKTTSNPSSRCRLWNNHRVLMGVTSLSSISSAAIWYRFFVPSWRYKHCSLSLNVCIFNVSSRISCIIMSLICICCSILDTAGRLTLSWRFLWFWVERDDFMNLFQNLYHSAHILGILDILCLHFLNILRNRHIWTFEDIHS